MTSDFEPLAEGLEKMFGRLGLPDPRVMSAVMSDWDILAASPWRGKSSSSGLIQVMPSRDSAWLISHVLATEALR